MTSLPGDAGLLGGSQALGEHPVVQRGVDLTLDRQRVGHQEAPRSPGAQRRAAMMAATSWGESTRAGTAWPESAR